MIKRVLFLILIPVLIFGNELAQPTIVSLSPVTTEIIYALGAHHQLLAVTTECNYPIEATYKEKIGDVNPNYEKILSLNPSIVIGMGNGTTVKNKLESLAIAHDIIKTPKSVDNIFDAIRTIGKLTEHKKEASILIKSLKSDLSRLKKKRKKLKHKAKVLVIIWHPPLLVAAKDSYLTEYIELAGGENCVDIEKIEFPQINLENLLVYNPDLIVLANPNIQESLKSSKVITETTAGKNNKILSSMDPDTLLRPGPRFISAIQIIQDALLSL